MSFFFPSFLFPVFFSRLATSSTFYFNIISFILILKLWHIFLLQLLRHFQLIFYYRPSMQYAVQLYSTPPPPTSVHMTSSNLPIDRNVQLLWRPFPSFHLRRYSLSFQLKKHRTKFNSPISIVHNGLANPCVIFGFFFNIFLYFLFLLYLSNTERWCVFLLPAWVESKAF